MPVKCSGCQKALGATAECSSCQSFRSFAPTLLGGERAFQVYTRERFKHSDITYAALQAAITFDPRRENIYLHGPTGTGKSHLAIIAAREHLPAVLTYSPSQMVGMLMETRRGAEELAAIQRLSKNKVLVIDDLGTENDTKASAAKLYEVINRRYQDSPGGLIVTSNLNLDQLAERLGEDRISSRLYEMCAYGERVFNLEGEPDHRLKKETTP
jgi:DNA replication protein DnaC